MVEKEKKGFKISKGRRKVGVNGTVLEEEWLQVEADTQQSCEEMFDKRWTK